MTLDWGGNVNGSIGLSAMQAIPSANFKPIYPEVTSGRGGNCLMPEAARQFTGIASAFRGKFGVDLAVSEAYRPLVRQQELYNAYEHGSGVLAAWPGTSNHGWGRSVDLANGIGTWSSTTHSFMATEGAKYGFHFTVPSEGWHMDYLGAPSVIVPASGPTPVVIVTNKELDAMSSIGYVQTLNASTADTTKKRNAGDIPKGWVFAIDIQNKTIEHVTFDKQIGLGTTLNPGGKLLGMNANTAWSYKDAGYKCIGW